MPLPEEASSEDLLARLRETPDANVAKGVSRVERLTQEEEEQFKRGVRVRTLTGYSNIRVAFYWFLFVVVCLSLLLAVGSMFYLTRVWVLSFIDKPEEVRDFLFDVMFTILVIFATLFFEGIFSRRE